MRGEEAQERVARHLAVADGAREGAEPLDAPAGGGGGGGVTGVEEVRGGEEERRGGGER
jgi:hypothetical protein